MAAKNVGKADDNLLPPDGGWGFVVTLAVATVIGTTIVPTGVFGVVYGPFLATIGDETSGTAIANSAFNTALCFAGLPANQLLQRTSYRAVGLLGAVLYFLGSFSCIFVTSSAQLVTTWGILQGMGFGLMMPAAFTAFNRYFHARRNAAMAMSQVLVAAINVSSPFLATLSMDTFGFRGTVALISACGLHCFPAVLSLHPVEWHMKKNPSGENLQMFKLSVNNLVENEELRPGGKLLNLWKSVEKALDLGLFKQPSFVNIVLGLSLSMTSDLAFVSILPLLLTTAGLNTDELTLVLTVYFTADLISRIFVFFLTSFIEISSRKLFLFGALFSAIFRILYILHDSFWWIIVISALLGFLRSFIQIPLPLVVAEAFPTRFVTAFSLYMVVCGCVALLFGPLMGFVKQITGRLDMVFHLLTLAHIFCAIPWLIEMTYAKFVKK